MLTIEINSYNIIILVIGTVPIDYNDKDIRRTNTQDDGT